MSRFLYVIAAALIMTFSATSSAYALDMDCKDFASQAEAQAYFEAGGGSPSYNYNNLDADHDGVACEAFNYGNASGDNTDPGNGDGGNTDPGDDQDIVAEIIAILIRILNEILGV